MQHCGDIETTRRSIRLMAYGLGLAARMYEVHTYVVCVKKRKGERQRRALKFMWLSGVLDEVAAYRTARQVTATAALRALFT